MINAYFISGLAANCKVFDNLILPDNYKKNYIEWHLPRIDETLEEYVKDISLKIDIKRPFILIGYSFGGIIVQDMNRFVKPKQNIIIASIKDESEIPPLYRFGKKIKFAERFPFWSLAENPKVRERLSLLLYGIKEAEASQYISCTDPVYLQWSVKQILNWKPSVKCENIYHIHGTRDQVFPAKYMKNCILIKGGDHLMVIKRYKKINNALLQILYDNV